MHLESLDGSAELTLTIAGYAFPDNLSSETDVNWLEVDLSVRTPHGSGTSRICPMLTWNGDQFVEWLEAITAVDSAPPPPLSFLPYPNNLVVNVLAKDPQNKGLPPYIISGFPFPDNFSVSVLAKDPQNIRLEVYFVLELPGHWEMDDSSADLIYPHYVGKMELMVPQAALRSAAASFRVELQRFPRRKPES
jgi:hypothetical protein